MDQVVIPFVGTTVASRDASTLTHLLGFVLNPIIKKKRLPDTYSLTMVLDSFTPELARSAGLADNRFPQTDEEADIAESVLTRELEKLSLDEHEKILFEIHGIASTPEEDPETLDNMLQEVENAIHKMKRKKKEAYELAKFLNPTYVESKRFRLQFLRSECFDPKAAAQTIVTHFDIKRKIFGDGEVLARDVVQADLNEEDMEKLRGGFLQILPRRDAAGRTVICLNLGFKRQNELASPLSRCSWYFMMNAMRDEDAQRAGVVYVMYNYCQHREEVDFQREIHQLRSALPQRTHAAHYCYDDRNLRPFVTGVRLFLDKTSRFRLRPHCGTPEEIEFQLQTFGIPTECSPMQKDGSWDVTWHNEWLAANRAREETEAQTVQDDDNNATNDNNKESIIVPRKFDVLFGRGKIAKTHTGNLRALLLCEMNYSRYESPLSGKYGKTEVADQIVRMIHESGGRFLRPENGGWVEVDDTDAREKIAHFFRHMRFKVKTTMTSSSTTDASSSSLNESESSSEEFMTDSPVSAAKKLAGVKRVTPCPSPAFVSAV